MKIGIDARMYRSGVAGIGRYSQNLIKNLLEIDKENQYILFMTSADAEEFKKKKIENRNYQIRIADIDHFSLGEQIRLPKILKNENLDLMHFLNFNHPVRYRGKFIVTVHDLTLYHYPQTARDTNLWKQIAFKYVMKKACTNAEKIIAVSEHTKKDIIEHFKLPDEKIKVIYEAADDKTFSEVNQKDIVVLKAKYNIHEPVILYVGQFRYHKNIKRLIEAFEIIKQNTTVKLVLLGKAEGIDKFPKSSDIVMPGFVDDKELAIWYKLASVFVFPSFYEGFGLPGLEAMKAGLPVVASNQGSLPEIYKNAALYFDPYDTKDIADKIKVVVENQKMRQELIQKGQTVSSQYSWRKTAEETLEVYKKISN